MHVFLLVKCFARVRHFLHLEVMQKCNYVNYGT